MGKTPEFWKNAAIAWSIVNYTEPVTKSEILQTSIGFNLKLNILRVYEDHYQKGLLYIGDFWSEENFRWQTYEETKELWGVANFLAFHSVIGNIPASWSLIMMENIEDGETQTKFDKLMEQYESERSVSKWIYEIL